MPILKSIHSIFASKGKIPVIKKALDKKIKTVLNQVQLNGSNISSAADCQVVIAFVDLLIKRDVLRTYWEHCMTSEDAPFISWDSPCPEMACYKWYNHIEYYVYWWKEEFPCFKQDIQAAGIELDSVFSKEFLEPAEELGQNEIMTRLAFKIISTELLQYIQLSTLFTEIIEIEQRKNAALTMLRESEYGRSSLCAALINALESGDADAYGSKYQQLIGW